MTNEEKAREIAGGLNFPISGYESGEYDGAIAMAEWKDHQFKETKDAFIAFCHNIINEMYVSVVDAAKEQLKYLEKLD